MKFSNSSFEKNLCILHGQVFVRLKITYGLFSIKEIGKLILFGFLHLKRLENNFIADTMT